MDRHNFLRPVLTPQEQLGKSSYRSRKDCEKLHDAWLYKVDDVGVKELDGLMP